MLVLNMIYVDLIVKKKIYRYFEMSFSCFGSFGVWGMINLPMSRTESKYKTKKKNVSFFPLKCIGFLVIHVATLLELKQVLKEFLNLEIYRTIKLLDQTER